MKVISKDINIEADKNMQEYTEDNLEAIIDFIYNEDIYIDIETNIKVSYYGKELYNFSLSDLSTDNFLYWFDLIDKRN